MVIIQSDGNVSRFQVSVVVVVPAWLIGCPGQSVLRHQPHLHTQRPPAWYALSVTVRSASCQLSPFDLLFLPYLGRTSGLEFRERSIQKTIGSGQCPVYDVGLFALYRSRTSSQIFGLVVIGISDSDQGPSHPSSACYPRAAGHVTPGWESLSFNHLLLSLPLTYLTHLHDAYSASHFTPCGFVHKLMYYLMFLDPCYHVVLPFASAGCFHGAVIYPQLSQMTLLTRFGRVAVSSGSPE